MQNLGLLNMPIFTYYKEEEREHYIQICNALDIKKYELMKTQDFNFSI